MDQINEGELVELVIDFDELKKNELNESWLRMFGGVVKLLLGKMFGGPGMPAPYKVKGSPGDVSAFARALGSEKRYIDAVTKHGLDNPRAFRSKSALDRAIKAFEEQTGIKWPFK